MKKRWISWLLVLTMVAALMPQMAIEARAVQSGTCGDNLTWVLDDEGTLTISGTGEMWDYEWGDAPWYSSRASIKTIQIDDGITAIGDCAFPYCSILTSVTIPNGVSSVGESAFNGCASLTSITIPQSVVNIGLYAFSDCRELAKIHVDNSNLNYSSDERGVLFDKDKIELIQAPGAISGYYGVPDTVKTIAWGAFSSCNSLNEIRISDSVTVIAVFAFLSCSSLTSVTIGNSVETIGDSAFSGCDGLVSITIPDSVRYIGDSAFGGCDGLTSITIPDSVKSIGDGPFESCTNLTEILVDESNPSFSNDEMGVLFNKQKTMIIQAPGAINGTYSIPDTVSTIGDSSFCSCKRLTSILIPYSVKRVDFRAFEGCSGLSDVYYTGTEEQWSDIRISISNERLTNATIHFGTSAPDDPTFTLPQDGDYVLIYAPQYNVALSSLKTGYYNQGRTLTADDGTYTGYYKSEIWQVHITSDGSYEFFQNGKSLGMSADYSHLDLGPNNWWKLTDIGNGRYTLRNTRTGKYLEWVPNSEIWYANHSNYSNTNQQMQLAFHVLDDSDPKINGFDPILDGWCLINTEASFGYEDPYYIPFGRYYEVDVNFSSIANSIFGRKWAGSCFGMSLLAAAQYNGDIDLSSYFDKSGEYLNDFGYDDIVDSTFTKNGEVRYDGDIYSVAGNEDIIAMIERAQVSQYSSEIQDIEVFKNDGADYSEVLAHLNQDHPTPLLISIDLGDLGGHAVVTDTSHKPIPLGNGVYAILLYDSTYPQIINNLQHGWSLYQHRQSYLQIDTKNGHFWYYHNGETDGWQVYKDWTGRKIWFYDVSRLKPGFFTNKLRFSTTHTTTSFDASNLIITERGSSKVLFEMKDMDSTLYADDIEYYRYCEGLCEDADTAKGYLLIPDGAYSFTNNDSATVSFISNDCVMSYEVMDDAQVHYSLDDTSVVVKNSNDTELTFTCAIQNVDSTAVISANGILDPGCGASIKVNFDGDVPAISVITDSDPEQMRTSFTVDGEIIQEDFHTVGIINPFTDVPEGSFYYEPVMWAVEEGITNGATETTYNPNGTCLRAQVVTFLHRAAGNPEPSSSSNPFIDAKPSDFFYKPVLWAVENGITNGTSATTFGSYANCNRAAVVTFLWRAAGSPEPKSSGNPFKDVKASDFFYKPVLWAVENGITNGVDATHFGPATDCNRAQVVTFLYRAHN